MCSILARVTRKYVVLERLYHIVFSFFLVYRTTEICHQFEASSVKVSFCVFFFCLFGGKEGVYLLIFIVVFIVKHVK